MPASGTGHGRLRGHSWRELKAKFRAACQKADAPCWLCEQQIDYAADWRQPTAFEADHYHPLSTHPHLALVMGNLRPSHQSCNRSRGNKSAGGTWVKASW